VHALHPKTLKLETYPDNPSEVMNSLLQYFQAVSDCINEITDKMIWNAHFKSVNFLAGKKKSMPYLNVDSLKRDLFHEFGPDNVFSVAAKMNQSWHRVCTKSAMVRYSEKDYPMSQQNERKYSPFVEIEEASRTLLLSESTDHELAAGRVFNRPGKKRASIASASNECNATSSDVQNGPKDLLDTSKYVTRGNTGQVVPATNTVGIDRCALSGAWLAHPGRFQLSFA
jgi:hypothetical protein